MRRWLNAYRNGVRFMAVPLTPQAREGLKCLYCVRRVRTDITGEHYEVLAPWAGCAIGRAMRSYYAEKYGPEAARRLFG